MSEDQKTEDTPVAGNDSAHRYAKAGDKKPRKVDPDASLDVIRTVGAPGTTRVRVTIR